MSFIPNAKKAPNPAYYVPSNLSGPGGKRTMWVSSLASTMAGATFYGFCCWYFTLPLPIVASCFAGLYIAGRGIAYGGHRGKVRDPKAYANIGVVCGMLFLFLQWLVFTALDQSNPQGSLTEFWRLFKYYSLSPGEAYDLAEKAAESGRWASKLLPVSGFLLWAAWQLESIILMIGIIAVGTKDDRAPFSESADRWLGEEVLPAKLAPVEDTDELRQLLEAEEQDLTPLQTIPLSDDPNFFSRLSLYHCEGGDTAYLTLANVTITKGLFGRRKERRSVFTLLKLPAETAVAIAERVRALV